MGLPNMRAASSYASHMSDESTTHASRLQSAFSAHLGKSASEWSELYLAHMRMVPFGCGDLLRTSGAVWFIVSTFVALTPLIVESAVADLAWNCLSIASHAMRSMYR